MDVHDFDTAISDGYLASLDGPCGRNLEGNKRCCSKARRGLKEVPSIGRHGKPSSHQRVKMKTAPAPFTKRAPTAIVRPSLLSATELPNSSNFLLSALLK